MSATVHLATVDQLREQLIGYGHGPMSSTRAAALVLTRPGKAAALARRNAAHPNPDIAAIGEAMLAGLAIVSRCRECGRELSDPESVAAGIGPDCEAAKAGAAT